jgi:hypothetical protein
MPWIASGLNRLPSLAIVVLASAVLGCGSATVSNETANDSVSGAPSMIYVHNFDLGAATVKSDPGTLTGRPRLIHFGQTDPATKLEELSDLMAKSIVEDLHRKNLPARRLANDAPRPANGWLMSGAFLEVDEGNRMQNAVLGFGAGSANADLYVVLADLARPEGKQNLLEFDVNAKGDKMPGGGAATVVTHTPWGMAAKFALERHASERDIRRAAQTIADDLEKFVRNHPAAQP